MIFKSENHKAGYLRLKREYQGFRDLVDSFGGDISRFFEKTFDNYVDRCWGEIFETFKDGWIESVQDEIDNAEWAGSPEGIFEVVDRHVG